MDITLRTPISFSELGQKDNQEDRLYPAAGASAASRTFIMCDGMGGHERGEVAAEIVSRTLGTTLDADSATSVSEESFNTALKQCYKTLDENLSGNDTRKPGTTLTCIRLGSNGVLEAHIGDSRIYQVRPGVGIMFRTEDHSLVNELVRAGQLTEAEARVHPRRNVITRAMMPGATNPAHADVSVLTDVRDGDFFFLCCDGVLEKLTESQLIKILSNSATTDAAKMSAIKATCDTGTRDNYTAWLVPVDKVSGNDTPEGRPVITVKTATATEGGAMKAVKDVQKKEISATGKRGIIYGAGIFVLCALVAVLALILFGGSDSGDQKEKDTKEQPIEKTEAAESETTEAEETTTAETARDAARSVRTQRKKDKKETADPENPAKPEEAKLPEEAKPNTENNAAAAAAAATSRRKTDPKTEPEPISEPTPQPATPAQPSTPDEPAPIVE